MLHNSARAKVAFCDSCTAFTSNTTQPAGRYFLHYSKQFLTRTRLQPQQWNKGSLIPRASISTTLAMNSSEKKSSTNDNRNAWARIRENLYPQLHLCSAPVSILVSSSSLSHAYCESKPANAQISLMIQTLRTEAFVTSTFSRSKARKIRQRRAFAGSAAQSRM